MDTKKLWAFREELVNELVEIDRKWTAARLLASLEPSIKEKVKAQSKSILLDMAANLKALAEEL